MLVEYLFVGEVFTVSRLLSSATVVLLVAAAMTGTTISMRGSERVSIRVSPNVAFAPANLTINAMVEPNAANRTVEVIVDSENLFRRSEAPLEGDRAPRTNQFRFVGLPGGTYEIRVAVKGASDQELGSARTELRVVGDGIDQ